MLNINITKPDMCHQLQIHSDEIWNNKHSYIESLELYVSYRSMYSDITLCELQLNKHLYEFSGWFHIKDHLILVEELDNFYNPMFEIVTIDESNKNRINQCVNQLKSIQNQLEHIV